MAALSSRSASALSASGSCPRLPSSRLSVRVSAQRKSSRTTQASPPDGADWYEWTRNASKPRGRTVREEIEYRRRANELANNGKERKDLYTDNWDGSEYKGSQFNILTLLGLLFILTPLAGLAFAFLTYGDLWG